jgi:hypothetical protein
MSYQERRAIVLFISTALITALYTAIMLQRYPEAGAYSPEIFRYWGTFMLILIPVSIIAKIVIHILFSIANTVATREAEPDIEDERDRLIELKANRNALWVFTGGFLLAMVSLVLEQPPHVMFILLIGAGVASDMMSEASNFFYYRRGY